MVNLFEHNHSKIAGNSSEAIHLGLSQLQLKKYYQQIVLGKNSWLLFQNHLYKLKKEKDLRSTLVVLLSFTERKLRHYVLLYIIMTGN